MLEIHQSRLFRAATWLLKHFLLAVFGFSIAMVLATTLGASQITWAILYLIGPWLLRSAIVVGCVMGVAIIMESIRH
jgi:hypothetical protein